LGCLFNLKNRELLRFSPAVAASLLRDVVVQWRNNNKDNEDNNKDTKEIIYEDVSLMKQPQSGFECGGFVGTEFQPDSARKRSHNLHETCQLPCVQ
jgi:hypothetical protein